MIPGCRQVAVGLLIATVAISSLTPLALGSERIRTTREERVMAVNTVEMNSTVDKRLEIPDTGMSDTAVMSLKDVMIGNPVMISSPIEKESQVISIGVSQENKVKQGSGKAVSLFDTADSLVDDSVQLNVEQIIEVKPFGMKDSVRVLDSAPKKSSSAKSGNVRVDAGARLEATAEELNEVLFGRFAGMGAELLELQDRYGVNIAFAVGVAQCETTCGQYGFGREEYNNPYNIKTSSGPYKKYASFMEGTEAFFKLISGCYLNPEHSYYRDGSVAGIGKVYAENPEWANSVMSHMSNFIYRLNEVQ